MKCYDEAGAQGTLRMVYSQTDLMAQTSVALTGKHPEGAWSESRNSPSLDSLSGHVLCSIRYRYSSAERGHWRAGCADRDP